MKLSECSDERQQFLRERAKPLIAAQPGLLVLIVGTIQTPPGAGPDPVIELAR
jgi:hypothetical protein